MIFKATPDGFFIPGKKTPLKCALGKAGLTNNKREGDSKSPMGEWGIEYIYYRADKINAPECCFDLTPISSNDGWCDDPEHAAYNRPVKLPFEFSHEKLFRDDDLYDIVVVLDHNYHKPVAGEGSAIFMHIARPDYSGTEGCVALNKNDLLEVLKIAAKNSKIRITT